MDRDQFDALTRLIATKGSRRAALTALLGATLFGTDLESADALQDVSGEHRRHRRRGRRRGRRRDRCKSAGGWPRRRRPCCAGLVVDASGRCAAPCSSGTCCATGPCVNGVCGFCPSGQRCVGNQCVCDGGSCPGGCCDAQGVCQRGTRNEQCGNNGLACAACATPTPYCVGQVCQACSASICSNGCCDAATGICQAGTTATACGGSGGVCAACSGETPSCSGGKCVCTVGSCTSGCCNGTSCQPGTSNEVCGANGAACVACGGGTPTCNPLTGGGGGACGV